MKKTSWIRWSERKPEAGQNIIAILHPVYPDMPNGGYQLIFMGGAIISIVEKDAWGNRLNDVYWIELPQ